MKYILFFLLLATTVALAAPNNLQRDIVPATFTLSWSDNNHASNVYKVLRCLYVLDKSKIMDCATQNLQTCQTVATTTELHFSETPPRGEVFCYRVQSCVNESCSEPSDGLLGYDQPPYTISMKLIAPQRVHSGDKVTMRMEVKTAGKVQRYMWAQLDAKDVLSKIETTQQVVWVAPKVDKVRTFNFEAVVEDDYKLRDYRRFSVIVEP